MFDSKQPALIAQCGSTEDVVSAVNFAREQNLLLSVKCGGHSLPGKSTSDGGMMIDLSQMRSIEADANSMIMHTGVGGITLGGGVGRTDRGTVFYKASREFLEFYAELHATMPDEANIEPQFVPGEDGKPMALVEVVWNGDHAAGEKALAPMQRLHTAYRRI